jgi:hypothetical protein
LIDELIEGSNTGYLLFGDINMQLFPEKIALGNQSFPFDKFTNF